MAQLPFPLAVGGYGVFEWAGLGRDVQEWFAGNDGILHDWVQLPIAARVRIDNLIGRMMGRHPQEIHPENWPMVMDVWMERWHLMALFVPDAGAIAPPGTPEVEDRGVPK